VLMRNHFHLVWQTPKANLSEFIRHLNVSYTRYYNRRHQRVGDLLQGRFKAIVVEADSYLLELSRYVYLNPLRVEAVKRKSLREQLAYLRGYHWNSLRGYLSQTKGSRGWSTVSGVCRGVQGEISRVCGGRSEPGIFDPVGSIARAGGVGERRDFGSR
jgi:hypothetical protein